MNNNRNVSIGCFLVLCTFVSAHAQTTASDRSQTSPRNVPTVCAGSPGPECPTPVEASQIAYQYAVERLAVWQRRLKLEDWRISVLPARSTELKPKTLGAIRWDKGKKTATIWVLDPADYQLPFREMLDDMELTVVHELVHLELASLPRSQASRSTEERAVNGFADALLALDRGKK
jgi:hypothetical protein